MCVSLPAGGYFWGSPAWEDGQSQRDHVQRLLQCCPQPWTPPLLFPPAVPGSNHRRDRSQRGQPQSQYVRSYVNVFLCIFRPRCRRLLMKVHESLSERRFWMTRIQYPCSGRSFKCKSGMQVCTKLSNTQAMLNQHFHEVWSVCSCMTVCERKIHRVHLWNSCKQSPTWRRVKTDAALRRRSLLSSSLNVLYLVCSHTLLRRGGTKAANQGIFSRCLLAIKDNGIGNNQSSAPSNLFLLCWTFYTSHLHPATHLCPATA